MRNLKSVFFHRLGICDTRIAKHSKVFVTYCKACCKHNTQRVVNGVYMISNGVKKLQKKSYTVAHIQSKCVS